MLNYNNIHLFHKYGNYDVPKTPGIYAIMNILNGKKYIGSTTDLYKRYRQHYSNLSKGKHINIILQRAFDKYGENNFRFIILEKCDNVRETLLQLEQKYIDECGDYNICKTAGNTTGIKHKNWKFTDKMRESIIKSNKERIWNKETLKKKSEFMKNSELNKHLRKPVIAISLDNEEIIKEFDSISSAALWIGYENARVSIKRCCLGKYKTAYNYKWRFKNDL